MPEKNGGIRILLEVLWTCIMHDMQLIEFIITHTHIWMKFRGISESLSVYPWLCVRPTAFFVLWHISHTMFGMWVYHHGTMCHMHSWPLYDLDLSHQYESYIFTMNLSLARFSLLFDRGIPNFGLWVYHHETKCFVHSWPLTYIWVVGVSIVSITHSFYFVYLDFLDHILVLAFKRILH